jgi:hypothetical protein
MDAASCAALPRPRPCLFKFDLKVNKLATGPGSQRCMAQTIQHHAAGRSAVLVYEHVILVRYCLRSALRVRRAAGEVMDKVDTCRASEALPDRDHS